MIDLSTLITNADGITRRDTRVLFIGAHQDDIEIGASQFIMDLIKREQATDNFFHELYLRFLVVTDGRYGCGSRDNYASVVSARSQEQANVLHHLKTIPASGRNHLDIRVSPLSYLMQDTSLNTPSRGLVVNIERAIEDIQADCVFTHFPEDTNQDHRSVGMATITAARQVPRVMFYQGYTSREFVPSVFHEFNESQLDEKLSLLKIHKSQWARYEKTRFNMGDACRALAQYNGYLCKTAKMFAEGFIPHRWIL